MALMDDLGKALKDGKIDPKEIEKMAKDVVPGLDLGALAKGFASDKDTKKDIKENSKKDTKTDSKKNTKADSKKDTKHDTKDVTKSAVTGMGLDPAQMTQIMGMLGGLDTKSLDPNAIAKQFGIPADVVKQVLAMLKK